MFNSIKAALFAALTVTLATVGIYAAPGFASGNTEANMAIAAETIYIDPALLALAEAEQRLVSDATVKVTVTNNGDVIYTPSIGNAQPMAIPQEALVEESFDNQDNVINASSLAGLVRKQNTDNTLNEQEQCLAGAVYFESKGEELAGQLAVAKVVLERSESGRFPSSICGVVYQKSQFSFIRGGRMPPINKSGTQWRNAVAIAKIAMADTWESPVEGALFFHAKYVSPGWKLKRIGAVDQHIFYR
jgi:spore germination cell wall hydrolase CwlJ-like protein